MKKRLKASGESIVEVLLAFTILAVVTTSVLVLFQQSLGLKENIRNREIALYLAQEGLEGVRNIRDTNWLQFSGDKRAQWMCLKASQMGNQLQCDESLSGRKIYRLNRPSSENGNFSLETFREETQELLFTEADFNDLSHSDLYEFFRIPLEAGDETNPFFRFLELTLENPYEGEIPSFCADNPQCKSAKLSIRSVVGWKEERGWKSITLETKLFDYLDRSTY